MKPVELTTRRLKLDQPRDADVNLVTQYCRDPIFERFMLTPWPYERSDAERFIGTVVPVFWADDTEYTWAIRANDVFLGLVGYRTGFHDIGFWLGEPHRGHGYMPEALRAVLDWVFARDSGEVLWECIPGNAASASVARKSGFRWLGEGPSLYPDRSGAETVAWRAALSASESREPKPGWPV